MGSLPLIGWHPKPVRLRQNCGPGSITAVPSAGPDRLTANRAAAKGGQAGMATEDPIRDLIGRRAAWRPSGDSLAWELVATDADSPAPALATMRAARPAYFAQAGSERWEIQEDTRRFGYRVVVRAAWTKQEVARLTWPLRWLGTFRAASLRFPARQRSLLWKRHGSALPVWAFHADDGRVLIWFRDSGSSRGGANVEVLSAAARYPELPLLLVIGWFLVEATSILTSPPEPMWGDPP